MERGIGKNGYEYNAYITYPQGDIEKRIARVLKLAVSTYKIPRYLRHKFKLRNIKAYLENSEAAQLDYMRFDEKEKLRSSQFLIVVCTPNTKENVRIRRQLEYFEELGRESNVIVLLLKGEPNDSFPQLLFRERKKIIQKDDGTTQESLEVIEPLAADIRADNFIKALSLLKIEKLRIIAQLICCNFDDLMRRYRQRKLRVYKLISAFIILCFIGIGINFFILWQRVIKDSKAAEQLESKKSQMFIRFFNDIPDIFSGDEEASGLISGILTREMWYLKYDLDYIEYNEGQDILSRTDINFDKILKVNPKDSINTVITKAIIQRRMGNSEASKESFEKLLKMFKAENFNGDPAKYVEMTKVFGEKVADLKLEGGIYVSKVEPKGNEFSTLREGDIIIKTKNEYVEVNMDSFEIFGRILMKNMEITYLRLDENNNFITKTFKVNSDYDNFNDLGVWFYEI